MSKQSNNTLDSSLLILPIPSSTPGVGLIIDVDPIASLESLSALKLSRLDNILVLKYKNKTFFID